MQGPERERVGGKRAIERVRQSERESPIEKGDSHRRQPGQRARQISGAISRTLTKSNNAQFNSDHWSSTMSAYHPNLPPSPPCSPVSPPAPDPALTPTSVGRTARKENTQARLVERRGGCPGPACICLSAGFQFAPVGDKLQSN